MSIDAQEGSIAIPQAAATRMMMLYEAAQLAVERRDAADAMLRAALCVPAGWLLIVADGHMMFTSATVEEPKEE